MYTRLGRTGWAAKERPRLFFPSSRFKTHCVYLIWCTKMCKVFVLLGIFSCVRVGWPHLAAAKVISGLADGWAGGGWLVHILHYNRSTSLFGLFVLARSGQIKWNWMETRADPQTTRFLWNFLIILEILIVVVVAHRPFAPLPSPFPPLICQHCNKHSLCSTYSMSESDDVLSCVWTHGRFRLIGENPSTTHSCSDWWRPIIKRRIINCAPAGSYIPI